MGASPDRTTDRRTDLGLGYEAETRTLLLGSAVRVVPDAGGNRAVLAAYVSLVAQARGNRPRTMAHVRAADLDALSTALDLDDVDIRSQVQELLGTSSVETTRLLTRLRQRRFLAGVAAAAVLGGLAAGVGAIGPMTSPASAAPSVVAAPRANPTPDTDGTPVVDGPLTVTEDGVGLIPPLEVDSNWVGLIPAEHIDAPPG